MGVNPCGTVGEGIPASMVQYVSNKGKMEGLNMTILHHRMTKRTTLFRTVSPSKWKNSFFVHFQRPMNDGITVILSALQVFPMLLM
jgi:hypothetical protein